MNETIHIAVTLGAFLFSLFSLLFWFVRMSTYFAAEQQKANEWYAYQIICALQRNPVEKKPLSRTGRLKMFLKRMIVSILRNDAYPRRS